MGETPNSTVFDSELGRMPRNVWILSGISLAVAVGFGVVAPVMPVYAVAFGVNEFAAAAVIAAFALARLVSAPLAAPLADRLGLRFVLILGVLVVAGSSLAVGLADSYWQMLLWRGLGGLGSAMFTVTAMTVLLASVDAAHRGRASALYQGAFLVGVVAGPAMGALLARISLRAPFFFYAGTLGVAAVVAVALRPTPGVGAASSRSKRPRPPQISARTPSGCSAGDGRQAADSEATASDDVEEQGRPLPLRRVIRDRRYQAALLAHLAQGWNTNGARSTLVPLFVAAFLAATPTDATAITGVAMSVAAAVQIAVIGPAGWAVDRFGRRQPMVIGAVVAALALVVVPYAGSAALLTVLLALYAVGSALLGTAPAAAVGDAAGPGGTRAIALYSMIGDFGAVSGPLIAGFLAAKLSYSWAFTVGAGIWLASAALSLTMPRQSSFTKTN
jgi:MFS family permease